MRLHPRTLPVQGHSSRLKSLVFDYQSANEDLTDTEMLGILLEITGRYQTWLLRAERHPDDPEKKADEA